MDSKNIKYLMLTIVLLILSGFSLFLIFKINPSPLNLLSSNLDKSTIPTPIPENNDFVESVPTVIPEIEITPVATSTNQIISPSPTIVPTITPIISPTATTSGNLSFNSSEDSFSINYSPNRKLYQDKESTGNRYTFYHSSGNFAVHVSPSGTWSWSTSSRNFSSNLIISGKNTYRYDIAAQTIVDLQSVTKNYTLQCVHNGNAILKTECESFLQSFKLL